MDRIDLVFKYMGLIARCAEKADIDVERAIRFVAAFTAAAPELQAITATTPPVTTPPTSAPPSSTVQ